METVMEGLRQQIADNKAVLPGLHERALELDLFPQPWWNRSFYEWAIQTAEANEGR